MRLRRQYKLDRKGRLTRTKSKAWNAKLGVVDGWKHAKGYRVLWFEGKTMYVHRVKFALKHGYFPRQVDHINGNRGDNRISNLRESDPQRNQENRRTSKKNRSGYRGVFFADGKWRAQLRIKYRRIELGRYERKDDAAAAVREYLKREKAVAIWGAV